METRFKLKVLLKGDDGINERDGYIIFKNTFKLDIALAPGMDIYLSSVELTAKIESVTLVFDWEREDRWMNVVASATLSGREFLSVQRRSSNRPEKYGWPIEKSKLLHDSGKD